jgi:fermentation-respiration switch protein FrsA (DUF1100 family)
VGIGITVVMLGLFGITAMQRRILFPRHLTLPMTSAGENILGLERHWIETEEGRVEGWWLPSGREGRRPAVIFAHGNAELIDYWPPLLDHYRRLGIGVLLPEYRGYGRSAGSPSQATITEDFVRFYDWISGREDVDPARIIFHGRSLGGGVVCALALQRKPALLILQSTFTSVRDMAARFFLPGFLVADPFDNLTVVRSLDVPVLVVHGRQDELVPLEQGERLARAARRGRLWVTEGDHNSTPPDWAEFFREVERFLREMGIIEREEGK